MKKLFITTTVLVSITAWGQVGVNTSKPQATFHVDGGKDNGSETPPTAAHQANDVVITSTGNVGVGTISPSTRLDIENGTVNGAIKIVDGTQAEGKILTSDANGVGTWKTISENNGTMIANSIPVTSRYIPNTPYIRIDGASIPHSLWTQVYQAAGTCYCQAWNSVEGYNHRTTIWAIGDSNPNTFSVYGLFFNDVYLGAYRSDINIWPNQNVRVPLPDRLTVSCL